MLEIEKEAFSNKPFLWRTQRVGVIVIVVFLLLTVCGFLGPALFKQDVLTNSSLTVQYDKYLHRNTEASFTVQINSNDQRAVTLWSTLSYFNEVVIKQINPSPSSIKTEHNHLVFSFDLKSNNPKTITFVIEPRESGVLYNELSLLNGPKILIKQFIYP